MRGCWLPIGLLSVVLAAQTSAALAQSTIPGAPSNAPPRVTVTGRADGIADKVETFFENVNMWANHIRQEKIKGRLENYLNQIGAKPTPGEVHIFFVQALTNDSGYVELTDFQYLTYGKTAEDALRESFTLEHSPGTEDRLDATRSGMRLAGIYVTATPEDGKFAIRGGSLSRDYYEKIRQEGLALRDKRAKERSEAERIEAIRKKRAATHAASDASAHAQLKRDIERGPLPPGPALFPPGPPSDTAPPVYLPPTQTGSQPTATPAPSQPSAHPRVPFDKPAPNTPPADGPAIPGPT